MAQTYLQQVRTLRNLEAAWRSVRENGKSSKSETVKQEIEAFDQDPSSNLRSMQQRLVRGTFQFPPARGVPIPKPGKKDIRPIVLASVEPRIVQRAILNVLQGIPALQPFFINPYSFRGIKRQKDQKLAAVPAAIQGVLDAIAGGAKYVICADISGFFTRISKSHVRHIIAKQVDDPAFMALYSDAIKVELNNLIELREKAEKFPIEDIGVAQGNSLSPLLGNIILHDFDQKMNAGDCRCLRYIDDFIILGPTAAAVRARLKLAKRLLEKLSMTFALDKTSPDALPLTGPVEFLGIQLCSGLIRPTAKARTKLLTSLNEITEQSRKAFNGYDSGKALKKSDALLANLRRIDGVIQGWGKHYWFCNDAVFFKNVDAEVIGILRRYLGQYSSARKAVGDDKSPALLGVELLGQLERKGFEWPSTVKPTQQTAPQPAEGHSEPLYPEGRADNRISARYALPKTGAAHGRPPDAPNPR